MCTLAARQVAHKDSIRDDSFICPSAATQTRLHDAVLIKINK